MDEVRYSSRGAGASPRGSTSSSTGLRARRSSTCASTSQSTGPSSSDGTVSTPAPVPTATPAPSRPEIAASDLSKEEARDLPDDYRRGIALVRQGAYDKAIQSLRDFLRTNRESPLVPNAQYWIGESYYMLADYYQAILNFNQVRQQHPKSDRAPRRC